MKKLFFTLALSLSALVALNAQEVGQVWVGGAVGFSSSKVKGASETIITYKILPEIGYAVSENIGVGMNLGYAHDEENAGVVGKNKTDYYTVSPFVRFSFLKGDLGALFVDALAGYTYAKTKNYSYTNDNKINMFEVGARPGVAFNVSDKVSLIGKFGFLGYQYVKNGDTKTNSFGFDFDMNQILVGACLKF